VVLDIGFGRGEVLIAMGLEHPECSLLGVEVSRKRVRKVARRLERAGVRNARLVHGTAEYLLERVLAPDSIAECWINFPDPWPKKRHHKRRLVRPDILVHLARILEPGGRLHIATDHTGYRDWIAGVMAAAGGLRNLHAPEAWSEKRPERAETGYEAEFVAEGRPIAYFAYGRGDAPGRGDPA
jgi:tRNA (guanine-N7-)-methyltransferase